jgi:hypothetical protein
LRDLAQLLADGRLTVSVVSTYGLLDASDALAEAISGRAGAAVSLTLKRTLRLPKHLCSLK